MAASRPKNSTTAASSADSLCGVGSTSTVATINSSSPPLLAAQNSAGQRGVPGVGSGSWRWLMCARGSVGHAGLDPAQQLGGGPAGLREVVALPDGLGDLDLGGGHGRGRPLLGDRAGRALPGGQVVQLDGPQLLAQPVHPLLGLGQVGAQVVHPGGQLRGELRRGHHLVQPDEADHVRPGGPDRPVPVVLGAGRGPLAAEQVTGVQAPQPAVAVQPRLVPGDQHRVPVVRRCPARPAARRRGRSR